MNAEKKLLTKLELLDAQIQRMQARRRKLVARQSGETRKMQSRKRFLAGVAILRLAAKDTGAAAVLNQALDQSLPTDRERALFGLPVRPTATTRLAKSPALIGPNAGSGGTTNSAV